MTHHPKPDLLPPALDVSLSDTLVGRLVNLGGDRTIFEFAESYVNMRAEFRPTLSASMFDRFGELNTHTRTFQQRVAPFFSNLLPEGPLRKYLARNVGVDERHEYALLNALGSDLAGAVTITPNTGNSTSRHQRCDSDIAPNATEPDETATAKTSPHSKLRFSLAGVQLKFSAIRDAAGGLTIPASGQGGHWIIKLPSPDYLMLVENEFSMMTLAKHVGVDVPEFGVAPLAEIDGLPNNIERFGTQAFAIKRFDRYENERVHIEDFAQVFGLFPESKYEKATIKSIGRVVSGLGHTHDSAELVRRIVFCALIGNGDMHLKNWSLIYPDGRNARLSPAYDLVSTIPYIPDDDMALTFASTKRFQAIDTAELCRFATASVIPEELVIETAQETVANFNACWNACKGELPLSPSIATAIDNHLASLPLLSV